jgi:hypothetical protein
MFVGANAKETGSQECMYLIENAARAEATCSG